MRIKNWKVYALWIGLAEMVGVLSGLLSRNGMTLYAETVEKPPLSPPGILFPIVWSLLYALMGIGAARVYLSPVSGNRTRALLLFGLQLIFNFFWSILFFNLQAFGFAFLWLTVLWGLILLMILSFARVDKPAALLQIPYLLWVTFALYLNAGVWILNR
jgi:tryptophan-rich sensory protein